MPVWSTLSSFFPLVPVAPSLAERRKGELACKICIVSWLFCFSAIWNAISPYSFRPSAFAPLLRKTRIASTLPSSTAAE